MRTATVGSSSERPTYGSLGIGGIDPRDLGEGRLTLGYSVLELTAQGQVVDDWEPPDLEQARSLLDPYPGARWEELPGDRTEARAVVEQRLATRGL